MNPSPLVGRERSTKRRIITKIIQMSKGEKRYFWKGETVKRRSQEGKKGGK